MPVVAMAHGRAGHWTAVEESSLPLVMRQERCHVTMFVT